MMHVMVVDADPVGRKLVRQAVGRCPGHDVVAEADSLDAAVETARREAPDVVIVAQSVLPGESKEIAGFVADTEAAMVLVALIGNGAAIWQGMSGGATGYLLRDRLASDLPQALTAAQSGGAFLSPPLTRQLIRYVADRLESGYDGPSATDVARLLLPRERETLLRLAAGESTEEIASAMSVTTATVRAYVSRIIRKLGLRSRGEAIALAYRSSFFSDST